MIGRRIYYFFLLGVFWNFFITLMSSGNVSPWYILVFNLASLKLLLHKMLSSSVKVHLFWYIFCFFFVFVLFCALVKLVSQIWRAEDMSTDNNHLLVLEESCQTNVTCACVTNLNQTLVLLCLLYKCNIFVFLKWKFKKTKSKRIIIWENIFGELIKERLLVQTYCVHQYLNEKS